MLKNYNVKNGNPIEKGIPNKVNMVNEKNESVNIEATKEYHNILVDHLRQIESNAITLLGTLLPAVGGFAWVLSVYLSPIQSQTQSLLDKQMLLFSVTVGAIVVMAWGLYHILALSYSYRCLVLVISNIEEELCLSKFTPNWKIRNENNVPKYRNILSPFNIAPATLRTHLCILSIAILGLAVIYQHIQDAIWKTIVLISAIFIIFVALILAHNIYPSKLHKCYQEVKNKMEQKKNEQKNKSAEMQCYKGIDWLDIVIISMLAGILWFLYVKKCLITDEYLGVGICVLIFLFGLTQLSRCYGVKIIKDFRNIWRKREIISKENLGDKQE